MNNDAIIVRCNRCSTKNRVPGNRVQDGPRCGKCGHTLHVDLSAGRPVKVTDATFQQEVLSSPGAVLVDCWAPWCGPCRMIGPIMDVLSAQYTGRVKIAKLNVDENPGIASQYAIQSIPTILFFKTGKVVDQLVGAVPQSEIERRLKMIM